MCWKAASRRIGNRVRVSAQLVEAANGSHIWADRFDRELVDVLALQDEITEQVVAAIEPAMLQSEGARIAHRGHTDLSALDYLLPAGHGSTWNKVSREGYGEGKHWPCPAAGWAPRRSDPDLSLGHIGLARILYGGAVYGWAANPIDDLKEALAAARTAIRLDARDAWRHFAASARRSSLASTTRQAGRRATDGVAQPQLRVRTLSAWPDADLRRTPRRRPWPRSSRALRESPYDPQAGPMLGSLALAPLSGQELPRGGGSGARGDLPGRGRSSEVLAASLEAASTGVTTIAEALTSSDSAPRDDSAGAGRPYANPSDEEHLREGLALAGIDPPKP